MSFIVEKIKNMGSSKKNNKQQNNFQDEDGEDYYSIASSAPSIADDTDYIKLPVNPLTSTPNIQQHVRFQPELDTTTIVRDSPPPMPAQRTFTKDRPATPSYSGGRSRSSNLLAPSPDNPYYQGTSRSSNDPLPPRGVLSQGQNRNYEDLFEALSHSYVRQEDKMRELTQQISNLSHRDDIESRSMQSRILEQSNKMEDYIKEFTRSQIENERRWRNWYSNFLI